MELVNLSIENFRNFEYSNINLSNRNVVFGMNDVGKTNLLYSLRYLLDRKIRNQGFLKSDYFQRDTTKNIVITLTIDISDRKTNKDSQNIISKLRGARTSDELHLVYFQVEGIFDEEENMGIPELYWGNDLDFLEKIPQNGTFSEIDKLFNIIYVDPTIDLEILFKKNRNRIFNQKKLTEKDIEISVEIDDLTDKVNEKISTMKIMQNFQEDLTTEYHNLKDEDITIQLQSEMAIKGFFSDIQPYIKKDGDEQLYPTSGDGRKKLLAYSLLNFLTKEFQSNKISIFLIEEPENSLHRSMQIALSKQLFEQYIYQYFILSTHSSEVLYEMDEATLIRVYSENKTNCESYMYHVPEEYSNIKKELNEGLTNALFSDRVLLVEGPSEKVLFEKVLSVINPRYELDGGYLLVVDGIKFKPYFDTLKGLNIIPIVKTDNDLKAKRNNKTHFDFIGFNRCLNLVEKDSLNHQVIDYSTIDENGKKVWSVSTKNKMLLDAKKEKYENENELLKEFEDNNIYLSEVDLEHDLYEAISEKLEDVFGNKPIEKLQNQKLINMIKLINELTEEDCRKIYEHDNFKSIRKLVELND